MRLFLDANVLFTAAHRSQGKAAFVIECASLGHWEVCTCELAIVEARRNLQIKLDESTERLTRLLRAVNVVVTVVDEPCPLELPAKDRPIFLSALNSECTHLLTGDLRHFGRHMNQPGATRGVCIQTVAEFLRCFEDK